MPKQYMKLRGRITEKYGTEKAFANALGVHQQQVSAKLNGKIGITDTNKKEWAKLLNIPTRKWGEYFFTN